MEGMRVSYVIIRKGLFSFSLRGVSMGSVWAPEPAAPSVPFSSIFSSALCTACRTKRQTVAAEPGEAGVGGWVCQVKSRKPKDGDSLSKVTQHSHEDGIMVEVPRGGRGQAVGIAVFLEFQGLFNS